MDKLRDINKITDHLFRENSGKMISILTKLFGLQNLDLIMDSVQDSFETALLKWKYEGIPVNPDGWLMKVAKNKTINSLKRENKTDLVFSSTFFKQFEEDLEDETDFVILPHEVADSQLRLLLTCCHPDFSEKNQVIITLNVLCGFGTTEIASALLMNIDAVKKAIARTKLELKQKGSVLRTPKLPNYEKRVSTVHTILYLMFNEGYKASRAKQIINHDLCYEAIRLAKLLLTSGVVLKEETKAMLALMFFNLSRFPTRVNHEGEIITLAEQDRSKWNSVFIEEGYFYLNDIENPDNLNRYYLEALIASLHCSAKNFEETNWETIVYLYNQLEIVLNSPVVTLNRIIAESYLNDPLVAIEKLGKLKSQNALKENYLIYAAEGDMFFRVKKPLKAKDSYTKALALAISPLDKEFLSRKISKC